MEPNRINDDSRYILSRLRKENAIAEKSIAWTQIYLIAVGAVIYYFFYDKHSESENIQLVAAILIGLLPALILRVFLTRNRHLEPGLTHLFIFLDASLVAAVSLIIFLYSDLPRTGFAHEIGVIGFLLLLVVRSVAYEKEHVISAGISSVFFILILGGLVEYDRFFSEGSVSIVTQLQYMVSMVNHCLIEIAIIIVSTVILSYSAHRARRLLVSSVREVTTAHGLLKIKHSELLKAKEQVDIANEVKASILSIMGHELRTPLNAVMGFSELIRQQALDDKLAEIAEDAECIKLSGERLLFLIDRMLLLSRKNQGIKIIPNNRSTTLTDIKFHISRIAQGLPKGNVDFKIIDSDLDGAVSTDLDLLKKIFYELMSNAIQFNNNYCRLTVKIELYEGAAERHLVISFIDNGIGIPAGEIERIFEVFYQIEHYSNRSINGAGVGLSICKKICDEMNIKIEVESILKKGSEFRLFLPLKESDKIDKLSQKIS